MERREDETERVELKVKCVHQRFTLYPWGSPQEPAASQPSLMQAEEELMYGRVVSIFHNAWQQKKERERTSLGRIYRTMHLQGRFPLLPWLRLRQNK